MNPLFIIHFKDNTKFIGGNSYLHTKWEEIPNKPIKNILYQLPSGDYLTLVTFNKIYHYMEGTKDFNGEKRGQLQIESCNLIIVRNDIPIQYVIKLQTGNIIIKTPTEDFINKSNPDYWKIGI